MTLNPEEVKEKFITELRSLGIYEDRVEWMQHPHAEDEDEENAPPPQLYGMFYLGDVAFSTRVQDPEQFDIDAEFKMLINEDRNNRKEDVVKDLDKLLGN